MTSDTGGQKGAKAEKYWQVPPAQLLLLAEEYSENMPATDPYDEAMRRVVEFWDGSSEHRLIRAARCLMDIAGDLDACGDRSTLSEIALSRVLQGFTRMPPRAFRDLCLLYSFGGKKYSPLNWRRGYDFDLSYDACMRHMNAAMAGEDYDEESKLPHVLSAVWHCFTLHTFAADDWRYGKFDNRPSALMAVGLYDKRGVE